MRGRNERDEGQREDAGPRSDRQAQREKTVAGGDAGVRLLERKRREKGGRHRESERRWLEGLCEFVDPTLFSKNLIFLFLIVERLFLIQAVR